MWKPTEQFTGDLRLYYNRVETTAYYFVIPRSMRRIHSPAFIAPDANDTTSPIQNNNLGTDNRDIFDTALKLDFGLNYGTVTSVTDYNHTKEIDTGDAYDFRPIPNSLLWFFTGGVPGFLGGPFDESQSQYIDVKTWSQELRFTSPKVGGFSWIAGAYYLHTDRFISTGNLVDRGLGVPAVYHDRSWIRPIRLRPTPTRRSWPTARATTPGRFLVMRPTHSSPSGNWTSRCATTRTSARTRPIRRPNSCPPPRPTPARSAMRPLARRSPRARFATCPTRT